MIAALLASTLWFYADFDRPFVVDGKIHEARMKCGKVVEGKFGRGYAFVSPSKRCEGEFLTISDRDRLENFPWQEGSFSCFYRLPEGVEKLNYAPLWGFGGFWSFQWTWTGAQFSTQDGNRNTGRLDLKPSDFAPTREWRHFCATWNADELVCYYDGRKVASKAKPTRVDMRQVKRAAFRLGCRGDGSPAANLVADEVAIFSKALSPEEVSALAGSKAPALPADAFLAGHVEFPIFWRNQEDAAVRMKVWCPQAGDYAVELKVGGRAQPARTVRFARGENVLAAPFDPSRFRVGTYEYELSVKDGGGRTALSDRGRVEIRGRVERDSFKFLSWGGSSGSSLTNLTTLGITAVNIGAGQRDRGARAYLHHDIFLNYRLENSRRWKELELDPKRIAASAEETLAPCAGLHLWASTLVNSEVYGGTMQELTNNVILRARGRKALGFDPDLNIRWQPIELDYKKKGVKPFRGVMPDDDPTLKTIRWFWGEGFPAYAMNAASADAIRALSPGNVVWSEPNPSPVGLDMVADWVYDCKAETALQTLRRQYALARSKGVLNMPTLGMGYWHTFPPSGRHPTRRDAKGKPEPVTLAQSCDELMIKSWMALGAVRSDSLSYFSVDTWERGAEGFAAFTASPTNAVRTIGEPDALVRYGAFMRDRLRPAAELLRGLDNERLPVGVVWFDETDRAGGWVWARYHYRNQVMDALTRLPVGCDYLSDGELTAETLSQYRYLVLPMLNVVTASHDAMLRKLPSKVTLLTDSHATVGYPHGKCLKDMKYLTANGVLEFNRKGVDEPLGAFFADKGDELRRALGAWSDGDGTNAFTFVKEHGGVRYVTVVNNARRAGGSPMNLFNTGDGYRPCGAPCRIVTHFKVPKGGCVYEFNRENCSIVRLEDCSIALDYAPAEGRVFCVYPRPMEKLRMDVKDGFVRVALVDGEGRPAPGRQVIRLEVRDPDGAIHDESGLYAMEGGRVKIPLRFADDDPKGSFFSRWKVSAKELTTGETVQIRCDAFK